LPKVSVPNAIVVTTGYNLAQVGGTYYYRVNVDSTTMTSVNLKFTAIGNSLIYSVKGYILLWDNRISADYGTIGGEFNACISGYNLYYFNTADLDTNSSALNFYFGLSGYYFEKGDGNLQLLLKKLKILFILFIVYESRINVTSNYVSPYYKLIYTTWLSTNLCGLHLNWIVL
jgi:hypothetical protein